MAAIPPSRYLVRLEAEIANAGKTPSADPLRAELAACVARYGRIAEAEALLEDVRQRSLARTSVQLSAWRNLAEGFVLYFSQLQSGAREKFLRAQAVTAFAGSDKLDALASAWLAHMDYTSLRPRQMAENLTRSLKLSLASDHHVRSRASLVAAEALHYARRFDLARPWYERAQTHASLDGDAATLSAIMFNMAWLRMGAVRHGLLKGEAPNDSLSFARLGGESASSYDARIGSVAFRELDPLLQAETNSLDDRYDEALLIYADHLDRLRMTGGERWKCVFAADRSWCFARAGDHAAAAGAAAQAETLLSLDVQIDDRAATHSWLARTYSALGDLERSQRHEVAASLAWRDAEALHAEIVALVEAVEAE